MANPKATVFVKSVAKAYKPPAPKQKTSPATMMAKRTVRKPSSAKGPRAS